LKFLNAAFKNHNEFMLFITVSEILFSGRVAFGTAKISKEKQKKIACYSYLGDFSNLG